MSKFFWNLFPRQKSEHIPASTAVKTAPLDEEPPQPVKQAQPKVKITPPQIMVGTAQSVGMQREHNEDTLYAMNAILADGDMDVPFGIFIVADGLGGHLYGEIASGAAARTLGEYLLSHFYVPFMSGQSFPDRESVQEVMENGVREAHRSVVVNAPGGGTTLTAAMIIGDKVTISHVGDSRAYFLFSDGRAKVVTQDHSLVHHLQELGQIDEKEAIIHPQRNVLYRALGQSEPFRPDIITLTLPVSGSMLICSDGLWGVVTDDEIIGIVGSAPNLSIACHELVEAANSAGGPDNISAILVKYLC